MIYIVDADDFCEDNNSLDVLWNIKGNNPNFKITLFTIIGRCSLRFLGTIKNIDWINMVPHGLLHDTNRECEHWDYKKCKSYITLVKAYGLEKGYKSPGWVIPDAMYQVLLEYNYWVADQTYNNERRPKELRAYLLDKPGRLHYHIGNLGGVNKNEISLYADYLSKLQGDFAFIKDVV